MTEMIRPFKVAIVGSDHWCKAIAEIILSEKLTRHGFELIGIACADAGAEAYRYARENGIYAFTDYRDLYGLKDLDLIIELTGQDEVTNDISKTKPAHIRLMDHVAASVLWEVFQIEEQTLAEQQGAEKATKAAFAELNQIFNTAADGMCLIDKDFNVLKINDTFAQMFLINKQKIKGKKCYDILPGLACNTSRCCLIRILKGEKRIEFETKKKRSDGSEIHCIVTASPFFGADGEMIGIVEDTKDISLLKDVENKLQKSFQDLQKAFEGTILAMSQTVESKDPYTAGHQRRVSNLAYAIALEMGLSTHQADGIRMAGLIHDIGKISVPAEILTKPGHITKKEIALIKDHPQVGYDILKGIAFPWPIAQIVLQHHEKMDGSGYPQGLLGKDILLEARIMGVADVLEGIASYRPYRPALGIDAALKEITENKNLLYDAQVVDICLKLFQEKQFEFEKKVFDNFRFGW